MKLFSVGKILCEKLKAVEFYFHSIVDPGGSTMCERNPFTF